MQQQLQKLSKKELRAFCVQLASQVDPTVVSQSLEFLSNSNTTPTSFESPTIVEPSGEQHQQPTSRKVFDISAYGTRRVALKVAYFGEKYHGFATNNEPDDQTIETALLTAMRKVRLIPPEACHLPVDYSRCGRTDRGVSALSQVVALSLRARSKPHEHAEQLDYCSMLNRVLPKDILVTAWSPCSDEFDARFKCIARTYRYYVSLSNEYNIKEMKQACSLFEGVHDFRNFCKMDVENLAHFMRRVDSCKLMVDDRGVGYCEIKGNAFLWHQVRMMMAVLFLIGQGKESVEIITKLFDVEAMPRRPLYDMAPEDALILYATEFKEDLDWRISQDASRIVSQTLQARYAQLALGLTLTRDVLNGVGLPLIQQQQQPSYIPFSHRPLGKSLEERVDALKPEKKLKYLKLQLSHQQDRVLSFLNGAAVGGSRSEEEEEVE